MRVSAVAALALAVVAGSPSCGPKPPPQAPLLVAAASSLRELLETTAGAFAEAHPGTRLEFSFEASSTLARKISAGAPFDVFLSADAETADRVRDALDAATVRPFLANRLALVRREGLADPARDPAELPGRSGTIALAGPAVPAGRYARAWLAQAGILDALAPRIVSADNVRAALALVDSGAADYGFVYATDAPAARRASVAWTDESGRGPPIRYVAGVLSRSRAPAAHDYVGFLAGERFLAAAEVRGFRRP
jgi:molybdate transport system substrate-binding protein